MKKTKAFLMSFLAAAVFVGFFGCSSDNTSNDETTDETSQEVLTPVEQVQKIVYPIQTPFEITEMLNKARASYILDVTNPVENVDKYFTEKSKALNLGIYGADLSYSSTYNKVQETRNFLTCSKKLTDELGIVTPFNENLTARIEENIENKDSLYSIITDSYHDTFEYLNETEKGAISTLIIAGGWVEGIYIATQLAILSENNAEIMKGIANQRNTLITLLPLLETYPENKDVQDVVAQLNKINDVYSSMEEKDGELQVTPEKFEELLSVTDEVRNYFVKTY